jgi:hypothetical protein
MRRSAAWSDVAFVDEQEALSGRYSNSVGGGSPGIAAGEEARIVLDAGAGAGGGDHFEVEVGALLQPLRLQQLALALSSFRRVASSNLMPSIACFSVGPGRDIVAVGVDAHLNSSFAVFLPVSGSNSVILDLVAEEGDAPGHCPHSGREDLQIVAAHAEGAARKGGVVALVLQRDELADELALVDRARPFSGRRSSPNRSRPSRCRRCRRPRRR